MDATRFIATRTPDNLKLIVLHEVARDFELISEEGTDCLLERSCGDSYHGFYSLETGYKAFLSPKNQSLTWLENPAVVNPLCPTPVDPCCVLPSTAPQFTAGQTANNYTYNIAIKTSKPAVNAACFTLCSDEDYKGIVQAIADAVKLIKVDYPTFVLSATSIWINSVDCCPKQLACITDIAKLIVDVNAVIAAPVVVVTPPECSGFATLPPGVPVKVIGLSATGQCVVGAAGGGGALDGVISGFSYDAVANTFVITRTVGAPLVVPAAAFIADLLSSVTKAAVQTGTNLSHPDAFIGLDNSLYLGKPTNLVELKDANGVVIGVFPNYAGIVV